MNNVNCARALDQPPNSDIICSFPISNDTIYEGDEFIVMVLRVINNATNIILLERKCAIGHVLINRNQGKLLCGFVMDMQLLSAAIVCTYII